MLNRTIFFLLSITSVLAIDFNDFFHQQQQQQEGYEDGEEAPQQCENKSGNYLCPVTK
jgi:hypothetical protein